MLIRYNITEVTVNARGRAPSRVGALHYHFKQKCRYRKSHIILKHINVSAPYCFPVKNNSRPGALTPAFTVLNMIT